jgi:diguanylate cyclase (GGDEF)-like protein
VGHEAKVLGALALFNRNNGEPFVESDERLAEGLAHYTATAFERETLIDELRRSEDHLRQLARTDSLTGLPNRAHFFECLAEALDHPRSRLHSLAMLFIDLDGFKDVNDSLGHQAGDQVLREVGERFLAFSRETDTVARVGGDEFALLLKDVDLPASALAIAGRLISILERPFHIDGGRSIRVSASVGISFHSGVRSLPRAQEVAREADIALYQAKAAGRGQAVLFAPSLSTHAMDRLELQSDLQSAVARGELRLHYHPIVTLEEGQVIGYEALVRWQHPRRGLLPPSAFIPLAEETGFIRSIGRWVLAQACRQSNSWAVNRATASVPSLSVNLSASQFDDIELVEQVRATLKSMGLRADMLT